jgi:hypothetical protein
LLQEREGPGIAPRPFKCTPKGAEPPAHLPCAKPLSTKQFRRTGFLKTRAVAGKIGYQIGYRYGDTSQTSTRRQPWAVLASTPPMSHIGRQRSVTFLGTGTGPITALPAVGRPGGRRRTWRAWLLSCLPTAAAPREHPLQQAASSPAPKPPPTTMPSARSTALTSVETTRPARSMPFGQAPPPPGRVSERRRFSGAGVPKGFSSPRARVRKPGVC